MSETTTATMLDRLHNTLGELVAALAEVEVYTEQPTNTSVDTDLFRWEAIIWRAADILATPDGPARRHWSRTMGLEAACRSWAHAAAACQVYALMASPSRQDLFEGHMGPVSSNLARWRAGMGWAVKG